MKRFDIINFLIEKYNLKRYLEIGVFQGECFNKVRCDKKTSIDPNFPATYKMESDEFFLINAETFDIVFIDGLHTAEQAYKDIVNSYKWLNPGGFILVHDCNPKTEWHTRPPEEYKCGEEWNGMTYRGYLRFKKTFPHITVYTIDTDYGVGVISDRRYIETLGGGHFEFFDTHRIELLDLISEEKFKEMF